MTQPNPHPPNVPEWLINRVDEHGNRLQGVEREVMGLHTKQHGLDVKITALAEKMTEAQASNATKIDQMAKVLDAIRVKQLEDAAVSRAMISVSETSRETRKEVSEWVRWIAPTVVAFLLYIAGKGVI